MPAMPPPVADERHALRDYLFQQQYAFRAMAFGLTDDQARATPTVSALSVGGLIKHVTSCQRGWMERVAAAPDAPPADERSITELQAERADEFEMRPDETLAEVLERFEAANAEALRLVETADLDVLGEPRRVTRYGHRRAEVLERFEAGNAEALRLVETADLDAPVPVPRDAPWFPKDVEAWSVRWVFFHLLEELARHAGHGDIVREAVDGATMYELLAGLEGWPETDWLTPFRPASA